MGFGPTWLKKLYTGLKGGDSPENDSRVEAQEILIGSGTAFRNDWIRLRSEHPDLVGSG